VATGVMYIDPPPPVAPTFIPWNHIGVKQLTW
jgi:hypothetical protein